MCVCVSLPGNPTRSLRRFVRQKLEESGWTDEMRRQIKGMCVCGRGAVVRTFDTMSSGSFLLHGPAELAYGRGMKGVSVPGLVQELLPEARAAIPDDIKTSSLAKVRAFLEKEG